MKIVIVGGGTIGWLATLYLSKGHNVVNISTDEVPIIGVGEGTTGKFLDVFKGTNVTELMIAFDALPKLGIKFDGWSRHRDTFFSPLDGTDTASYYLDYSTYAQTFVDHRIGTISDLSILAHAGASNYYATDNVLNLDYASHGLHIDAYKTAAALKEQCIDNHVLHHDNKVVKVNRKQGKVSSLKLDDGRSVRADLYIDCSGFSKVLNDDMGWVDYTEYLPVNRALIYDGGDGKCAPYTTATAKKYGWTWEIPTRNKIGRGYVYCDKYASEDDILEELGDVEKLRSIEFESGRIEQFIKGNVISMGLSSGFLEPLQATSIHCAIMQLELMHYSFPDEDFIDNELSIARYNELCCRLFDDMRDFVALHYTGGKTDSEFWTSMNVPERTLNLIKLANTRLLRSFDFEHTSGTVKQESWNPILQGLGHLNKCSIPTVFDADGANMQWWITRNEDRINQVQSEMHDKNYLTTDQLNDILRSVSPEMT